MVKFERCTLTPANQGFSQSKIEKAKSMTTLTSKHRTFDGRQTVRHEGMQFLNELGKSRLAARRFRSEIRMLRHCSASKVLRQGVSQLTDARNSCETTGRDAVHVPRAHRTTKIQAGPELSCCEGLQSQLGTRRGTRQSGQEPAGSALNRQLPLVSTSTRLVAYITDTGSQVCRSRVESSRVEAPSDARSYTMYMQRRLLSERSFRCQDCGFQQEQGLPKLIFALRAAQPSRRVFAKSTRVVHDLRRTSAYQFGSLRLVRQMSSRFAWRHVLFSSAPLCRQSQKPKLSTSHCSSSDNFARYFLY